MDSTSGIKYPRQFDEESNEPPRKKSRIEIHERLPFELWVGIFSHTSPNDWKKIELSSKFFQEGTKIVWKDFSRLNGFTHSFLFSQNKANPSKVNFTINNAIRKIIETTPTDLHKCRKLIRKLTPLANAYSRIHFYLKHRFPNLFGGYPYEAGTGEKIIESLILQNAYLTRPTFKQVKGKILCKRKQDCESFLNTCTIKNFYFRGTKQHLKFMKDVAFDSASKGDYDPLATLIRLEQQNHKLFPKEFRQFLNQLYEKNKNSLPPILAYLGFEYMKTPATYAQGEIMFKKGREGWKDAPDSFEEIEKIKKNRHRTKPQSRKRKRCEETLVHNCKKKRTDDLQILPPEMWGCIFSFLSLKTWLNIELTCKLFKEFSILFWKNCRKSNGFEYDWGASKGTYNPEKVEFLLSYTIDQILRADPFIYNYTKTIGKFKKIINAFPILNDLIVELFLEKHKFYRFNLWTGDHLLENLIFQEVFLNRPSNIDAVNSFVGTKELGCSRFTNLYSIIHIYHKGKRAQFVNLKEIAFDAALKGDYHPLGTFISLEKRHGKFYPREFVLFLEDLYANGKNNFPAILASLKKEYQKDLNYAMLNRFEELLDNVHEN